MTQQDYKRAAAEAALAFVPKGELLGVGTGSTVECFIELLAQHARDIPGAVSSSERSSAKLRAAGIPTVDLNSAGPLSVYIDGADEANPNFQLIKGGGGALTREKVLAAASRQFVCIIDDSKWVPVLGGFPLPVEVLPMAQSYVARELVKLGGLPKLREGFISDNGNVILDVTGMNLEDPSRIEVELSLISGVVAVGLFARRGADRMLIGGPGGVRMIMTKGDGK